jgi:hypothetical protein
MQSEKLEQTGVTPSILTDKELVNFAERYLDKGMPLNFQKELLQRFDQRVNG